MATPRDALRAAARGRNSANAGGGVTIQGADAILRNLARAGINGIKALGAGVYTTGQNIRTDAMRRTPVGDTGSLRGSAYLTVPKADDPTCEIGFGGPAVPYAVVQHEHTEYRHEVGEAKFLENALNAASGNYASSVAKFAQRAFERGAGPVRNPSVPATPGEGQG